MIYFKSTENIETFLLPVFYICITLINLTSADFVPGTHCSTSEDCLFSGDAICDTESHKCVCKDGKFMVEFAHCMLIKKLGEICDFTGQCSEYDPNSACEPRGSHDPNPKLCQCRFGFKEEVVKGHKECVDAHFTLFRTGGLYFDRRDTVPIVMGSLAAGFALLACCAGIVQFVRKKHHNQTYQQSTESVPPPEAIMLNTPNLLLSSPTSGRHYAPFHPYFPRTLLDVPPPVDAVQMEDLPPSYEEAVKQPPILLSVKETAT